MGNRVFQVENLHFSYGKHSVLNGLNLSVPQGKITTLIGANGCGKSTLFQLMTKNLAPESGTIRYQGKNIADMKLKDFAREVAIVHQYNTAPADLTVEKLISYGRTPYHTFGMSGNRQEDEEKIRQAMEITGVAELKSQPVAELSGGQRQRVWIAMALAQDTKMLFLDEPTTYLDIRYQLEILKLVRRLNDDYGMTILMVLHDINQSVYYSDEIVAMKNGSVLASGTAEKVINEELIRDVYGVELKITEITGRKFILRV